MRDGWKLVKLEEVCHIIGGGTPSKKNTSFYGGNVSWATVRDMKGDIIRETELKITEAGLKGSSTNMISRGNVVIATRVGLGKVCFLEKDTAINQDLKGIVPKKSTLLPKFIFWWFKTVSDQIIKAGTGATVQGVKLPFVKSLLIPEISISEQELVIATLEDAFAAIDQAKANIEKNIANAKELFQSKLNEIFSQKGEGWEEKTFDDVISSSLIGLVRNNKQQSQDYPFRYLKMNNIRNDNGLDEKHFVYVQASDEEVEKYHLKDGDFLFNTRNSYELVGKTCVYKSKYKNPVLFNNNILRVTFKSFLLSEYVAFAFCSPQIKEALERMKSGTTSVVGIYYKSLKDLLIPIPPMEEQKTVIKELETLKEKQKVLMEFYRQKSWRLEELKKSILQKAFAGELTAKEVAV